MAAALPPARWWPLAIVGIAIWAWAVEAASWPFRIALGAVVGATHFLVALLWVPEFSLPGFVLLTLLETAFWAAAGVAATGAWSPLALAGALVLAEYSRSHFPFEGLPLAGVDLGQAGGPFLAVARIAGGIGVVLAAGLTGAGLALGARRRWGAAGVACGLAALLTVGGALAPDGQDLGTPLQAAVVQGGGPRGFRGVDTDFAEVFDRHLQAAADIDGGVDLVLWPENSVTVDGEFAGSPEEQALHDLADTLDAAIVAGVVEDGPPGTFLNAAYPIEPGKEQGLPVFKAIRVPFGEYVPFRSFFDRFADLSALPTEAVAGHGPGVLLLESGFVGVSISYEVFFAERSREAVSGGAELLLVPTNAASFRTTQVPGQELAAARLRAVEAGRWLLQAAPTGYSGVVDPSGRVIMRSDLGTQQVLEAEVHPRRGLTPFALLGPWPALLLAFGLVAGSWLAGRRNRPRRPAA